MLDPIGYKLLYALATHIYLSYIIDYTKINKYNATAGVSLLI